MRVAELAEDVVKRALLRLSPGLLFRLQHYKLHSSRGRHRYWANPRRPRTFNEHIMASKLDSRNRRLGAFVDKAAVKAFVATAIPERHVIPTYGVFRTTNDLRAARIPMPCVVKPTHLSGQVLFLTDEAEVSNEENTRLVARWLRTNHYFRTGEPQYRDLVPGIIAEPFIGAERQPPNDFKFFCWNGEPRLLQVDSDRFNGHKRDFFNMHGEHLPMQLRYPHAPSPPELPEQLDTMIDICRRLSLEFEFVRVDLYEVAGSVYFGELTFHPDSGNAPFGDFASDLRLGALFTSA